MGKKVHLKLEDIQAKITKLETEKKDPSVQTNKTKRKRILSQLAKLQKALKEPEELVVDPTEEQKKMEEDRTRRIEKKLSRK